MIWSDFGQLIGAILLMVGALLTPTSPHVFNRALGQEEKEVGCQVLYLKTSLMLIPQPTRFFYEHQLLDIFDIHLRYRLQWLFCHRLIG